MAAKKTSKKTEPSTPVVEVKAENVEVKDTKSKAKTTSKTAAKTAEPVVENTVVSAPCEVVSDSHELSEMFTEFMAKSQTLLASASALKTEFRNLEKRSIRELKAAQKIKDKKKRKSGNRSPSGFVKPTLISTELATFLGKPTGTEMARTEVTREINGYIRLHNLQDKENGRKINPDKQLATLLKIKSGEELTYFNLQRYMSPHFAKAGASLPCVDASVPAASMTA